MTGADRSGRRYPTMQDGREMHDEVAVVLAVISALGTWTASVVALVYWLSSKFAALEKCMLKQMAEHDVRNETAFHHQDIRIQRLELKEFGFTASGTHGAGVGGFGP